MRSQRKAASPTKAKAGQEIKGQLQELESKLADVEDRLADLLAHQPNLLDPSVPDGQSEEANQIIRTVGEPTRFDFSPKDHLTIAESLDLIDVKRAATVSGSRFYYLKGWGARLRLALINFAFAKLIESGFTPFFTPHLAKERTMFGTGYLPFAKDDLYSIQGEDLHLIGTSEQTLVAYHSDELLTAADLPLRYCAYSRCFRTEAGSYGKDSHGIFRVHEFAKVEMIVFARPEESVKAWEAVQAIEEAMAVELALPYRVTEACAGDLSKAASRRFDIEVWFPSQERYREVTSNSNLLDFQTRRLNIRVKDKDGKKFYPHTISATAVTDRHLIAILENGQQKDGSIKIPKVLQEHTGFDRIG